MNSVCARWNSLKEVCRAGRWYWIPSFTFALEANSTLSNHFFFSFPTLFKLIKRYQNDAKKKMSKNLLLIIHPFIVQQTKNKKTLTHKKLSFCLYYINYYSYFQIVYLLTFLCSFIFFIFKIRTNQFFVLLLSTSTQTKNKSLKLYTNQLFIHVLLLLSN